MFEVQWLFLVVVQWSHLWFSAAVVRYSKVFLIFFQDTFGKILDMFEVQWSHLCFLQQILVHSKEGKTLQVTEICSI